MKHLSILLLLSLMTHLLNAQDKPILENDTLSYAGKKFYVGAEVTLGYGSGANKDFAFLYWGSGLAGVTALTANFAKTLVKVDKIYKQRGKYYFRAKAIESGPTLGAKVFGDIEGAIDNKEL